METKLLNQEKEVKPLYHKEGQLGGVPGAMVSLIVGVGIAVLVLILVGALAVLTTFLQHLQRIISLGYMPN